MKRCAAFLLLLEFLLSFTGCAERLQPKSELLPAGNVVHTDVSSLPEGYSYSYDGDDAAEIAKYLANLTLEELEKNPDGYGGMTWVISLTYENGSAVTVYHFGNMFIRTENGPWYQMLYDEAKQFDTLLEELNNKSS